MKLLFMLLLLPFCTQMGFGQSTEVQSLQSKEGEIEITIVSDQPFIIGAKDYHLYIDDEVFSRPRISNEGTQNYLSFTIPSATFDSLPSQSKVGLNYGRLKTKENPNSAAREQSRLTILSGSFDKSKLISNE